MTACEQDQDGSVLILLASSMTYTIAVCTYSVKPLEGLPACCNILAMQDNQLPITHNDITTA